MTRHLSTGVPLALFGALARRIREWRAADPFGRIVVLAPEASIAQARRDTLPLAMGATAGDGVRGLFNVEIATLTTWAIARCRTRMIAEGRALLPRSAALAVVAAAVARTRESTGALAGAAAADDPRERPNFHRAVLTELINLKKGGRTPESLTEGSAHRYRREIADIYAASERIMGDAGRIDPSDVLRIAADIIARDGVGPEIAGVALWGFTALNDLERGVFRALAGDPVPQAAFVPLLDDAPAFALSAPLAREIAAAWGVIPEPADPVSPAPVLPIVADLFRADRADVHDVPELSLVSAPDVVREWEEVARWIWDRMREDETLRFSDIHVAAPRLDEVRTIARDAFAAADIPAYWRGGTSLVDTDAGRSLILFLDAIESGLARGPVMELLTACPTPERWLEGHVEGRRVEVPPTEWDRIARLAGIVGGLDRERQVGREWLERLQGFAGRIAHRLEDPLAEWDDEDIRESRERLALDYAYTHALGNAIKELIEARQAVEDAARTGRWDAWVAALRAGWRRSTSFPPAEAEAVARIDAVLDEIAGYGEIVPLAPLATCRRLLEIALDTLALPSDPTTDAGVWIGDIAEAGWRPCRIAIVTGLMDPDFPTPEGRTALALAPPETVRWESIDGRVAEFDRRIAEGHLAYAVALAAASDAVRISYARAKPGEDERHLPSSVYLETLRRAVPPLLTEDGRSRVWEERTLRPGIATYTRGTWLVRRAIPEVSPTLRYLNAAELELAWSGRLRGLPVGETWVRGLSEHAGHGLDLLRARSGAALSPWDGTIADPVLLAEIRRALGAGRPISPSRLEMYACCPFRYFATHVLRLERIPEPAYELALDAAQAGKLLHGLLARYFREIRDEGVDLRVPAEELRARFLALAARYEREITGYAETPADVLWRAQWETIRARAWRAVELARREADRWEPQWIELGLGVRPDRLREGRIDPESGLDPISVAGPHGRIALHGIIDRVDVSRDGTAARIVDYKSGRAPDTERAHLDAGQRVQLVVYARGLQDWLKSLGVKRTVTEAAYHYLRDAPPPDAAPGSKAWPVRALDADGLADAERDLADVIETVLGGIGGGLFAPVPDWDGRSGSPGPCAYCEVAAACGSTMEVARRWTALISAEELIPLRALRETTGEKSATDRTEDAD